MTGKILFLLTFIVLLSCSSPNLDDDATWKTFVSKDAGLKLDYPCIPEKSVKSFQDIENPFKIYSFKCEIGDILFQINLKHYEKDLGENEISKIFSDNEKAFNNKEFGLKLIESKKIDKYPNIEGKFYKVKNGEGKNIYHLEFVEKQKDYILLVGNTKREVKQESFEKFANKFIDSFEILK